MKDLWLHPIRAFAVLCVAVISAYTMWMDYRVVEKIASPAWCKTALGAEKASSTDSIIKGLDACVVIIKIQVQGLVTDSHIRSGVLAGCLIVLIVIVIAGGKLSFAVNKTGAAANIGKDDVAPVQVMNAPNGPVPTSEEKPKEAAAKVPPMFREDK